MSVKAVSRSLVTPSSITLEDGSIVLGSQYGGVVKIVWTPLVNGDTGSLVDLTQFSDRSVQVEGTFGAGGSVNIEGSNDGVNFHTLNDPLGNALTITSASLKGVLEATGFIRPNVTAGDGTTSLTITMSAGRSL